MRFKKRNLWKVGVILVLVICCIVYIYKHQGKSSLEDKFISVELLVKNYVAASERQRDLARSLLKLTSKIFPDHSGNNSAVHNISIKIQSNAVNNSKIRSMPQRLAYQTIIKVDNLCEMNPQFVVFVHSQPHHIIRRNLIRETWGSQALVLNGVLLFVLGLRSTGKQDDNLQNEANENNNDVLQFSFVDNYQNLVLKSVMSLKFIEELNCPTLKYIIKTDDDVMLNLKRINDIVAKFKDDEGSFVLGAEAPNNQVQRLGKWQVSVEQYPESHFPPHLSGAAYGLSLNAVMKLAKLSDIIPPIPIEDVYVTGLLVQEAGFKFSFREDFPSWMTRGPKAECDFIRGRIVGLHGYTSRDKVNKLWTKLTSGASCYIR